MGIRIGINGSGRMGRYLFGWAIPPEPDLYDVWHSSKTSPGGLNFILK